MEKKMISKTAAVILSLITVAGFILSVTGNFPKERAATKESINYDPELIVYSRGWTVCSGDETFSPARFPFHVGGSGAKGLIMTNTLPANVTGGTFLAFRISSCFTDVYIGDKLIFSSPVIENAGKKTPLPGWVSIPLEEEYSGRTIRIEASDPYFLHGITVPRILVGSHAEVLLYASGLSYTDYYISVAVIILGLLVVFFAFMSSGRRSETVRNAALGCFIAVAGIYYLCRAGMTRMDAYQSYIEYMIAAASLRLCPLIFALFMGRQTPEENHKIPNILAMIFLAVLAAAYILNLIGIADLTSTEPVFYALMIAELIIATASERKSLGSSRFKALPIAGSVCAALSFILSSLPILSAYEAAIHARYILLFIFALASALDLALSVSYEAERSAVLAKELSESRMKIMMSQMQPHFIYNTLSTIRAMIQKSPEEARALIFDFTKYLRFNINALGNVPIIPIEEELEHTKVYTDIEQARFGDNLKVVYDIREDSFSVPPLTVQPFVENAVKHGIRKDEEGGSVFVRTFAEGDSYIIEIEDNGTGFDASKLDEFGKKGVGIMNAAARLKEQTGASVDIDSRCGEGTKVRISVPKNWEGRDENDTRR